MGIGLHRSYSYRLQRKTMSSDLPNRFVNGNPKLLIVINKVTSEWEIGLFPEGDDEKSAALGSLELGASECAELGEVLWTEVGHLMLLPVGP